MARFTQIIGLTEEAENFIDQNVRRYEKDKCHHCGRSEIGIYKQDYDAVTAVREGMFDDGPILYEYQMKDGSVYREVLQTCIWSSGPCIFLCLERAKDGKRCFEWAQEEIDNC